MKDEDAKFKVQKRSGKLVAFKHDKISQAIYSCLVNSCDFIDEKALNVSSEVTEKVFERLSKFNNNISVEQIQDYVEVTLMQTGQHEAAKQYILYRDERRRLREQPSIFKKRIAFKPFEYPDIIAFKDAINHSYWLVSEWNFKEDLQDFNVKLTANERNVIKNALLAISQIEVSVKEFWARLGERFPKSEFKQVGITFAESEVRHADAYSHLLQVLGLDDAFDNILKVPAIRSRVNYLTETMGGMATDIDEDYVLTLTLFCLFIENVSLFSQFAIVKAFNKHKNSLKDVDNVIQATQQEEQIHALFGITIIKYIKKERPKWFGKTFWDRINQMSQKAYEAECQIIDWIFENGELDFCPKDSLKEFVKKRLNDSIESIGGIAPFKINNEILTSLLWFTEEIDAEVSTDFFHKRPVTYSKKVQSITESDLFA